MRPFYFLLKISLNISFRLFYKRFIVLRKHKKLFGSTVYVSNHPNSFMDPIMIGALNHPIVHFMTRSDVFVWWLKPILWSAHMTPIYRQHDGGDMKGKNTDVFKKVNQSLIERLLRHLRWKVRWCGQGSQLLRPVTAGQVCLSQKTEFYRYLKRHQTRGWHQPWCPPFIYVCAQR